MFNVLVWAALSINIGVGERVASPWSVVGPDIASTPGLRVVSTDVGRMASLRGRDQAVIDGFSLSDGRVVTLDLNRVKVLADDARVVMSRMQRDGRVVDRALEHATVDCFSGTVAGEAGSRAYIAMWDGGQIGWVESQGRTHFISSGHEGNENAIAIYDPAVLPADRLKIEPFVCEQETVSPVKAPPVALGNGGLAGDEAPPCRRVRMAVETDWQYLSVANHGDTFRAQAYAIALFGAVNELYAVDLNSSFEIVFFRLWETSADPWNQPSSSGQLYQFRDYWLDNMQDVDRDLAHFLSGRKLGGGVAFLEGICETLDGFGLSGNLSGSFPYPLDVDGNGQNWDVVVVTHEIGHNFGAPHTHDYSPPLDGCGLGDCSNASEGTLMSYCHTCDGGLSNINLYFHPGNVATMLAYLEQTCDLTAQAAPPLAVNDFVTVEAGATISIDVLHNDLQASCNDVTIQSFDKVTALGGAVALSSGTGVDGLDELVYDAPEGSALDSFTYTVQDAFGATATGTVNVDVLVYREPDAPVNPLPGVKVGYYTLTHPEALPDFNLLTPFKLETVQKIDYESTEGAFAGSGLMNNVGAVFNGYFMAPQDDVYGLYLSSDDGSKLYVGDELLIDNDGLHGMVELPGSIALKAGLHKIRVEFFEATGGAGLIVGVVGGGLGKIAIPSPLWFKAGPNPDLNQDGAVNGSDLGLLLAQWQLSGLGDLNEDGVVGGPDLGNPVGRMELSESVVAPSSRAA